MKWMFTYAFCLKANDSAEMSTESIGDIVVPVLFAPNMVGVLSSDIGQDSYIK